MINANWRWSKCIEDVILDKVTGANPDKILNLCAGFSGIGAYRIDRFFHKDLIPSKDNRITKLPNLKGDMCFIPLKSGSMDLVIFDPPYTPSAQKIIPDGIREIVRCLKPSGRLLSLMPWIPLHKTLLIKDIWLHPAGTKGAFPSYKILCEQIKVNGQISDYEN